MWARVLIGAGIGVVAGGLLGYVGKCRSGACPLTANPYMGALWGLLLGVLVTLSLGCRESRVSAEGSDKVIPVATRQEFEAKVIESEKPVVVDFFATWCGPCKILSPVIAKLADEYEGRATFLKVDTDAVGELARSYGISSIPTVVLFHKGLEERRWVGVQGSDTYRAAIEAIIQRELKPQNEMGKESAMPKREGVVTMKGSPVTLVGGEVKVGDPAPDFTAVANDLRDVKLSDYRGKTVVLASVPSLDTGVCATETRRFNQEAAGLGDNVVILTISMDLPFAQKRWCGAEGVDRVVTLSDHRDASFGSAYGVLIEGLRLLARAIFVVSPDGKIAYTQLVKEIATEPDYGPALAAVRELTGG